MVAAQALAHFFVVLVLIPTVIGVIVNFVISL
jgi:hypothetical protein